MTRRRRHHGRRLAACLLDKAIALLRLIDQYFEEALAAVCLCVVMCLLMVNIVLRVTFGIGMPWSIEVVRIMFVWFVYLGAALGVQRQGHIRIVSLVRLLPAGMLRPLTILIADILWLAFNVTVVWIATEMLYRFGQFTQRTPVLRIDIFWVYAVIPFCFGLMAFRLIQLYWRLGWRVSEAELGVEADGG